MLTKWLTNITESSQLGFLGAFAQEYKGILLHMHPFLYVRNIMPRLNKKKKKKITYLDSKKKFNHVKAFKWF